MADQIFRSYEFKQDHIRSVDFNDNYFMFCEFRDFETDGGLVDSDFAQCVFTNVDWYMGLFNIVYFFKCRFKNCIFRGTSFPDCRFVECSFENVEFIKDNLDSDCDFDLARSYNCKIINTHGFRVKES